MKKWLLAALIGALFLTETALAERLPLPEAPERVAVLFSSLADLWETAGGEAAVTVGESVERGFAAEGTPLVDNGAGKTVNLELLLSHKPDLVICSADVPAQAEAAELLNEAGIPALTLKIESFSDYLAALKTLTGLTGDDEAYEKEGLAVQAEIEALLSSEAARMAAGKRMLFVRAGSTDKSTKAKTADEHFACAMLEELGLINIADSAPQLSDALSLEAVLVENPDYIFFSLMGGEETARAHVEDMLSQPAWAALDAVKNGRAVILPRELFHFKPNARWAEAYAFLLDALNGGAE